jgi:rSAM/selenodomain-associated transferase 1
MSAERTAIAVMAKAPRAGQVKTRLVPPLTADEARTLSGCFLRDVTDNIARAGDAAPIDGYVAYAPAGGETLLAPVIAPGTRFVLADGAIAPRDGVTGFGTCLLHAAEGLCARGYRGVCLLNADSPTLPTRRLADAVAALAAPGDRIVLGPADDGGYYLIGFKAPHDHLFRDIAWSTADVAAQTRQRAGELGLELVELAPWYDVDDMASLRTLAAELDGQAPAWAGGSAAPATAGWFERSGVRARLAAVA